MRPIHNSIIAILISSFCLLSPGYIGAQITDIHKIDSLKAKLNVEKADTVKLRLLEALYVNTDCQDTASSLRYINEYLTIAQTLRRNENIADAYKWMGLHYSGCAKKFPKAIYWFRKAATQEHEIGDKKEEANVLSLLATSYKNNSEHAKAIEYYHASMKLDPDLDKVKGIYGNMGTVYLDIGDYPNAAVCFEKAYSIQNRQLLDNKKGTVNDSLSLMGLLISIADVDISMSQYDKALGYYQHAKELNRSIKNPLIDLWIAQGVGRCFQLKKDYPRAIQSYEEALHMSRDIKDIESESDILNRLGNIYIANGELDKAITHAQKALAMNQNNMNSGSLPGSYLLMGKIYAAKRNYPKAVGYLQKAVSLYNKTRKTDDESIAWAELSNAYEKMNRTADAYDAYKHHIVLRDSIFSIEKARQITSTEMRGEFERKQAAEKLVQAKKDAATKLHMQMQRWMIFCGFAALAMVLVFSLFVYRSYKKQKKANVIISNANSALRTEKQVSETLLLNILPADVASELKEKGRVTAKLFDNVTVLMTDFVDFTVLGERLSPEALVAELHTCFEAFDNIIGKYKIEKIKTVGDAYVAVSGLPNANAHHAEDITMAAIEIRDFIEQRKQALGMDTFGIRIGINSGKLVAGIVGVKKFAYDVWGDTVNIAARMEQSGAEGRINISHDTWMLVKDKFTCTYRGEIEAKNKGKLKMYFVEGLSA